MSDDDYYDYDDHAAPPPADEGRLRCGRLGNQNLHRLLGLHEPAVFCFRMSGDAMCGEEILDDDILVCQRSLQPVSGDLVIVQGLEGFLLRTWVEDPELSLRAAHPDHPDLTGEDLRGWELVGVITAMIRSYRGSRRRKRGRADRDPQRDY